MEEETSVDGEEVLVERPSEKNEPEDESDSCDDSSSSMSIISADEIEDFQVLENTDSAKENPGYSSDIMTLSQFGKAVFLDVADAYANTSDVTCKFSLPSNMSVMFTASGNSGGDSIGLFRVPSLRPCLLGHISEKDVCGNNGSVLFKGTNLPKEEDFYQFQYLRMSEGNIQTVLGASVPFLLRMLSKQTCNVQERLLEGVSIQSNFDEQVSGHLASDSVSHEADKIENCEVNASTSCDAINSKSKEELPNQIKADFACIMQDKVLLEQRLLKCTESLKLLKSERDSIAGTCLQKEMEKLLLQEDRDKISADLAGMKSLLHDMSEAKNQTAKLLETHDVQFKVCQYEISSLKAEVASQKTLLETQHHIMVKYENKIRELAEALKRLEDSQPTSNRVCRKYFKGQLGPNFEESGEDADKIDASEATLSTANDTTLNADGSSEDNVTVSSVVCPEEIDDTIAVSASSDVNLVASQEQLGSCPQSTESFQLTDDGNIVLVASTEESISCPFCNETFPPDKLRKLELHVDQHLSINLFCPVCGVRYDEDLFLAYRQHVEEHFVEED